jgi:hypothetical protein
MLRNGWLRSCEAQYKFANNMLFTVHEYIEDLTPPGFGNCVENVGSRCGSRQRGYP